MLGSPALAGKRASAIIANRYLPLRRSRDFLFISVVGKMQRRSCNERRRMVTGSPVGIEDNRELFLSRRAFREHNISSPSERGRMNRFWCSAGLFDALYLVLRPNSLEREAAAGRVSQVKEWGHGHPMAAAYFAQGCHIVRLYICVVSFSRLRKTRAPRRPNKIDFFAHSRYYTAFSFILRNANRAQLLLALF